jgi:hypothetical protein
MSEQPDWKHIKEIRLEHYLTGWRFCEQCLQQGYVRNAIIEHLNKSGTIPLSGTLINNKIKRLRFSGQFEKSIQSRCQNNIKRLDWMRDGMHSGKPHDIGYCGFLDIQIDPNTKNHCVALTFENDHLEKPDLRNGYISLQNIFVHNPKFYKQLTTCDNLLLSKNVKLSYNDISENIKKTINDTYVNRRKINTSRQYTRESSYYGRMALIIELLIICMLLFYHLII